MGKYHIAIYLRLSKEDDKLKKESNSIAMQRLLLQSYVAENFEECELSEFCDDGYTGTNFERPGMQAMLKMVKSGEIDCILVKDFSRFARDYIELGSWLEQIFPFLGVRFISVNDHYDSCDFQGSIAGLDVNFKNLLYDLYSKDLSGKVRSSLAARKEKGQYISANSPFGYEKDPKDRHALLIAEDEAEIVRRIFSLTVEGYTSVEIARLFNETRVKTPIEFKIEKGKTNKMPKGERFLWSSSAICQILRNEVYIGNTVQKKYTMDFVGGRNHLNPREEWLVTYGHHEPVIGKDIFDKVQEGRGKKRPPQYHQSHPLNGKMECGCCKRNLRYRRGLNPYFSCSQRYSNAMEHCVRKINAIFPEQYVLRMIQDKLQAEGEPKRLRMKEIRKRNKEIQELKEKRQALSAKKEKLKQQSFEAYQDYACGRTENFQSDSSALRAMEKELEDINEDIRKKEAAKDRIKGGIDNGDTDESVVLSKEMIEKYIDKIVVYDEQHMEIKWIETAGTAAVGQGNLAMI